MIVYADNTPVFRNDDHNTIKLFISQPMHGRRAEDIVASAMEIAKKYIEYMYDGPVKETYNYIKAAYEECDDEESDDENCLARYEVAGARDTNGMPIEPTAIFEVVDNVFHPCAPSDDQGVQNRIWMLGESIQRMSEADVIIFAPNVRSNSAGVTVEEAVADQYGLKQYFVFDDDPKVYEKFTRTHDVRESYREV